MKIAVLILLKLVIPQIAITRICKFVMKLYKSDSSQESLKPLYLASIPFDWKSPFGYGLVIFVQTLALICHAEFGTCIVVLYAGFCKFLTEFIFEIKDNLLCMGSDIEINCKNGIANLTRKFKETIQLHADVKQLTNNLSDWFNNHILAYLLFSFFRLTACLLEIHMTGHSLNILQIFVILFAALCFVFVFCFFGEELTSRFKSTDDALYQCDWYEFPLELQKKLPIAMILAQRPVYIGNFGSIHCTRVTFQKMIKTAFSYYLILRRFN